MPIFTCTFRLFTGRIFDFFHAHYFRFHGWKFSKIFTDKKRFSRVLFWGFSVFFTGTFFLGKRTVLTKKVGEKDSSVLTKEKRTLLTCEGHFCQRKDTSVIKTFHIQDMSLLCFEKDSSVIVKDSSVHQVRIFQNESFNENTSLSHITAQLSTIPTITIDFLSQSLLNP